MTKKKNKNVYAIALLLFVGAVGYLVYSGISENSIYFLNVSEALAMPTGETHSARLFGTVKAEGITFSANGTSVSFLLEDQTAPEQTLLVSFDGTIPDLFQAGAEVIVEGSFIAADGNAPTFTAHTLMTKCPSKYEKDNRS